MKLYDCRVRLAGLVHHEVPKFAATEKEIVLLRGLHGADAVVGIKSVGDATRTDDSEHQRLASIYGAELVENIFKITLQDLTVIHEEEPEEEVLPVETAGKKSGTLKLPEKV